MMFFHISIMIISFLYQATKYRIPRVSTVINKLPKDDLQVLRDRGMTYKQIAEEMKKRSEIQQIVNLKQFINIINRMEIL